MALEMFNPVIVDFYEQIGFLPDALLNYLLLLGWSLDGGRQEFSREAMIELFSLERVNKAPAASIRRSCWRFKIERCSSCR